MSMLYAILLSLTALNPVSQAEACPIPVPVNDTVGLARVSSLTSEVLSYIRQGQHLVSAVSTGNLALGLKAIGGIPGIPAPTANLITTGFNAAEGNWGAVFTQNMPESNRLLNQMGVNVSDQGKLDFNPTQAASHLTGLAGFDSVQREVTTHLTRCIDTGSCDYDPFDAAYLTIREYGNDEAIRAYDEVRQRKHYLDGTVREAVAHEGHRTFNEFYQNSEHHQTGREISNLITQCGIRDRSCSSRQQARSVENVLRASGNTEQANVVRDVLNKAPRGDYDPWKTVMTTMRDQGYDMSDRIAIDKIHQCANQGRCGKDDLLPALRDLSDPEINIRMDEHFGKDTRAWKNPDNRPVVSRDTQQRITHQLDVRSRADRAMTAVDYPQWGSSAQEALRSAPNHGDQCLALADLNMPSGTPTSPLPGHLAEDSGSLTRNSDHVLDAFYLPQGINPEGTQWPYTIRRARHIYAHETALDTLALTYAKRENSKTLNENLDQLRQRFRSCDNAACEARLIVDLERIRNHIAGEEIRLQMARLEFAQALAIQSHTLARPYH